MSAGSIPRCGSVRCTSCGRHMFRKKPETEVSQNTDIGRGTSGPQQERGQFGTADAAGWAWMTTAIAIVAASVVLALFWDRPITDDVAWYLIATRDWLGGAPLYETVVEVNPPLNFYFTVPAVLIADLFGLSDVNGQYVLTASSCSDRLPGAVPSSGPSLTFRRTPGAVAGRASAVAIVVPTLDSMGQREQIHDHLDDAMAAWPDRPGDAQATEARHCQCSGCRHR